MLLERRRDLTAGHFIKGVIMKKITTKDVNKARREVDKVYRIYTKYKVKRPRIYTNYK